MSIFRVLEMKKDLDMVLKRIAALKQRLAAQNPDAFRGKRNQGRQGLPDSLLES